MPENLCDIVERAKQKDNYFDAVLQPDGFVTGQWHLHLHGCPRGLLIFDGPHAEEKAKEWQELLLTKRLGPSPYKRT